MDNNNFSNDINNETNSQLNTMNNTNNENLQLNAMNNINNDINSTSIPTTNSNLNTFNSMNNMNSNINTFNSTNNIDPNINTFNNQNFNSAQNYGSNFNQDFSTGKPKGKKTILIVLVLLILVGVAGFFIFKIFGSNKNVANLNSIFDPKKPIVVKNNEKYGYITSDGKTMIEPQYNSAGDFYGDYALVSVDNPNKDSYNKTLYEIIDKKGNVKLTSESYYGTKYYSEYDLWVVDDVLYDSKLNKVLGEGTSVKYISNGYFMYTDSLKNESGIVNYKGKKVFTIPDLSISVGISDNYYNEDDLYATVRTYGTAKEMIVSLKTGDILFTSENADNYYISRKSNGIFYYYNHKTDDGYEKRKYLFFINNKLAYQTTEVVNDVSVYDYKNQILEIDYGYDYEKLGKSKRNYYYDVKNKKMLDEEPSRSTSSVDILEQSYGFKEYSVSGKYGIMSGDKVIVPCEYNDIEYLKINLFNYMKSKGKELVLLEKDKKLVLYNIKNSKSITTFDSNYVSSYDDSTFIRINLYGEDSYIKEYKIYNLLTGKSMDFDKSDEISIGSNYVTITKDGKTTYYNTEFKQIYVANVG